MRTVDVYKDGEKIGHYDSIVAAAKTYGLPYRRMCRIVLNETPIEDKIFVYANKRRHKTTRGKRMYAMYMGDEYIGEDTIMGWAKRLGMKPSTIEYYVYYAGHKRKLKRAFVRVDDEEE